MNVVGYIRVSTQGQAKEGYSLKYQEDEINAYCEEQGWNLIHIFRDEAGSVATLHHSQQKGVGPLYEASTRYHNIANAKRAPLHPYKGKLNPFYPMDETTRGAFQKVDSINYWKIRGEEALGGR